MAASCAMGPHRRGAASDAAVFTLIESLRAAGHAIVAHGFRSVLTVFGIVVGVGSVIAVVAVMQGFRDGMAAEFQGLGGNSLSISPLTPLEDALAGRVARLTASDLEAIRARVPGVAHITPLALSRDEARYGNQVAITEVRGTTHTYPRVYNAYERSGRFLSLADDRNRRRVCVIGDKTRAKLGLPEDPIGEHIALGGEWLKVVGVMERKGGLFGMSQDDHVTLPYHTLRSLSPPHLVPDLLIQLTVRDIAQLDAVAARIRAVLRHSRGIGPGEPDTFSVETAAEIAQVFDDVVAAITALIGGMVGISLLVGGVGIMNIMLVSVTERTRDIGICMALGASRRQILLQFLIEAAALSVLGGIIGLVAGLGMSALGGSLIPDFPGVSAPLWAIALAIGFSAFVGLAFGILPALRAAALSPIEALRHE